MLEKKFDYQEIINWILEEQSNKAEEILILGMPDNLDNLASIFKLQKQINFLTYKNLDLNEFCLNNQIENIDNISIFQELVSINDEIINWYTYNDERKNGIINFLEKNSENQNLKLISVEKKKSLSLINIIKKYSLENKKILLFLFEDHMIKESFLENIDFKDIVSIIYWNENKENYENVFKKNYSKKSIFDKTLNIWELNNNHLNNKIKDLSNKIRDLDITNDFLRKQNEDISEKNHNNLYSLKRFFPYERFLDFDEDINIQIEDKEKIFSKYDSNRSIFEKYFEDNSTLDYYQNLYRYPLFRLLSSNNKELSNIFSKRFISRKQESARRFVKIIGTTKNIANNQEHNFAKRFTLYNFSSSTMCTFIPKNACTSLRYSFALANGFVRDLDDIDWIHGNNDSQQATENELKNCCYSFIIIRSPFTRLSSYFLDKLVGNSEEIFSSDKSYGNTFLNKFCKLENLTFEKYINIIWENPNIIYKDIHTRPQIDFLLFDEYDKWISLDKLSKEIDEIDLKSKIKFIDTRKNVNNTTQGYKKITNKYHGNITINQLRDLKSKKFVPAHETLFNEETSYKILITYLSDIFLYLEKTNSYAELKKYLDLSNNYIKKKN